MRTMLLVMLIMFWIGWLPPIFRGTIYLSRGYLSLMTLSHRTSQDDDYEIIRARMMVVEDDLPCAHEESLTPPTTPRSDLWKSKFPTSEVEEAIANLTRTYHDLKADFD